jgi:D-lactate dehydrogenase
MKKTIRIAFFDTKSYDREYFLKAAERPEFAGLDFQFDFFEGHLTSSTVGLTKDHDAVCAFVNDRIDRAVADALASYGVDLVALRSAGYNNVDLEAVWEKVHVVRVPAYSPHAVAEHAVALLQTLNRRTHTAYNRTRDGNFALGGLVGRDLFGKTAGIIGTGKIGKILAGILHGFGMEVLLDDPYPDAAFAASIGARYVPRSELYAQSDVISLHCPLTPENHYMINAETLAQMKKDVILINTGRGALIDSKALIEALKDGRVRGAGLDVYEEEEEYFFEDWSLSPIRDDVLARLLQFPNVLLTAHQAFLTEEALGEIARVTLENIRQWSAGERMPNEICYQCTHTGKSAGCAREETGTCWVTKAG